MSALHQDYVIIRELARRKHEIGLLPRQQQSLRLWTDLNDRRPCRPLVWINEIPWHEFQAAAPAALSPRCQDPWLRAVEIGLRRELFQWEHFAGDMIVDPFLVCPLVGGPTSVYADYGLQAQEISAEGTQDVLFRPLIETAADVEKIQRPKVWVDRDETERRRQLLEEAVAGEIPVVVRGLVTQWHTPWDMAVRWYGVERLMYDLIDNPELVAAVCARMCAITGEVLDEQERLGLLDVGNGNYRVGSGGMGCSDELPAQLTGRRATPRDQWGCGNAQIFSEVSAEMHEEFSLRFERPVMERFGLSYYGCCEPLHTKIPMLRRIRNLRKISMSPKADLRVAAEAAGRDYVLSFKPNPAHLATDRFDADLVRRYLADALAAMRGCNVEIIMKDITTARSDVPRLSAWTKLAMEVAGQ
jgi:hypothetical protein